MSVDMIARGMSKANAIKYAAQYESIGITAIDPTDTGILFHLANNTTVPIDIKNWHSLSADEQNALLSINVKSDSNSFYSGDKTFKTVDRINNDNKDFPLATNMWNKVSDTEYTYTLNHKLNDENIQVAIYNAFNKLETVGVEIVDSDNIKLTSDNIIVGKAVINYSSSNSDRLTNTATIDSKYIFPTMTDVDNYFNVNKITLAYNLLISVGSAGSEKLYKWNGATNPNTYDNSLWSNVTAFIKGQKGEQGIQGIQGITGKSAYQSAIDNGFSGTEIEWLQTLDSCLGKYSSLADLKVAYPSGADKYKFAIISTVSGQVGIAFYDKTVSNWQVTVFASTNGSAVVRDDKSVGVNSLGNMELLGFENANVNTAPMKASNGEISYLNIKADSTNHITNIASQDYVDEAITGGISIQNDYYNASTNTPNITTINTGGKSFAWVVLVGGIQTLGGNSITFNAFDLVIKTSGGAYLKIHNGSTSWGSIIGDITEQTDLLNKLNEYAKIDDTDTTSAIKTYSIKHILELEDKKRKIFMQSDSPVGMVKDDIWIDSTSVPYSISAYDGSSWVGCGSAGGTKINDWVANTSYKVGEYAVHDSLLYRCTTATNAITFTSSEWVLISGHMVRDNSQFYTKRTNLKFTGNVAITDDSVNDNTIINIPTLTIKDSTTSYTQRNGLQFTGNGIKVTDDSTNNNTVVNVSAMTGATSSVDGTSGVIPKPTAGQQNYLFKGDGTWSANDVYPAVGTEIDTGMLWFDGRKIYRQSFTGTMSSSSVTVKASFAGVAVISFKGFGRRSDLAYETLGDVNSAILVSGTNLVLYNTGVLNGGNYYLVVDFVKTS